MKSNVYLIIPFVVLSFVYMILDIGGKKGFLPDMPAWLDGVWHYSFPIMATYILFVIGRQYLTALWRFLKTGAANMDTLI